MVAMSLRSVLISGAGVAGRSLAYWLARRGLRATVVEHSPVLRSSGNPVDVCGPALPVAREIGAYVGAGWRVPELLDQLRVTGALYFYSVSQGRGRPAHDSSLILGSPIRGSG